MLTEYVFFYNGQEITGAFKTSNSTSYPDNWCVNSTVSDLNDIGVVCLLKVYPSLEENEYYDGTYVDDFENNTRTYNVTVLEENPQYEITATGNTFINTSTFPNKSLILCFGIKCNDQEETISIGYSENESDLVSQDNYPLEEWKVVSVNMISGENIYFSGATGSVTYKAFLV